MTSIVYVVGDATRPWQVVDEQDKTTVRIIAHICNDRGGWGKGFVVALGKRYPTAREFYRHWAQAGNTFYLGAVQFVDVSMNTPSTLLVANMVAQHGYKDTKRRGIPLDYNALQRCLAKVATKAFALGASVHMPRIGTGNAGGSWAMIEPIIQGTLSVNGIQVVVYDLPGSQAQGMGLYK